MNAGRRIVLRRLLRHAILRLNPRGSWLHYCRNEIATNHVTSIVSLMGRDKNIVEWKIHCIHSGGSRISQGERQPLS